MVVRIAITVAIEEGVLCWLVLTRPEKTAFCAVGMMLVSIVSLGVQLWFEVRRYGIAA